MVSDQRYTGSIAIVGGGISGATLAIALLQRGLDVHIYEQAHKFGEIGAGVAFNPAAIRAMEICSPDITTAFYKVQTHNQDPKRSKVWFDWLDAMSDKTVGEEEFRFQLSNDLGANGVHRAHYLDEVIKVIPEGRTIFAKHLDTIEELADGKLKLKFHDGTDAVHDVVIGTDGIKSSVRAWMVGADSPSAKPVYTHKYAYRGLIPMPKAVEALGAELAQNAFMHMGQDGHILTFPVNHGAVMNVVAFYTDPNDWPDYKHLTRKSEKKQVYEDFKHFGATVHKIIDLLEPSLDCWAIFDTGDHPMPYYNKGKVLVLGDAGHATSPHHGSGAGMCIEDCAILAELLIDPRIAENGSKGIEAAFEAYTKQRLERTQWLVQSSRRSGELYDWRSELGSDSDKIEAECKWRNEKIWNGQVKEYIVEAKELLGKTLAA